MSSKKVVTSFSCIECGATYSKWVGRCTSCNSWNTVFDDEQKPPSLSQIGSQQKFKKFDISFEDASGDNISIEDRIFLKDFLELNRVLGGGIVCDSAILIGGEPGIGKSTLILSIASQILRSNTQRTVVYSSGEESINQIKMRASRLKIDNAKDIKLIATTNLSYLLNAIDLLKKGDTLIIDSIQTVFSEDFQGTVGSIMQVKTCANILINLCKQKGVCLFMIGHINKEGQIAGPKVLEHMVDVVLYFEEDRTSKFRLLRNIKNRFGDISEIGIYKMTQDGLFEIRNPSEIFLTERKNEQVGSIIFAGIEGSRPIFLQTETLISQSQMQQPRRSVVGWDQNRLAMILAILSTHSKLKLYDKEVFLNIAGGFKTDDPSLDLAVACAIFSSIFELPLRQDSIICGELSLSGEVKSVQFIDQRLKEASRLGFKKAYIPNQDCKSVDIEVVKISHISQVRKLFT